VPKQGVLEVDGKQVKVTNLEKVLYPAASFTKADVIDYYIATSPVLLPHLKNRPISLKRYPDGVEGFFFYEKRCPPSRPDWVDTARVSSRRKEGFIDYCVMNELSALVWAANLADLDVSRPGCGPGSDAGAVRLGVHAERAETRGQIVDPLRWCAVVVQRDAGFAVPQCVIEGLAQMPGHDPVGR
jgi:hypothetical protein